MCEYLVEMGGDLNVVNHRNWKPIEAASVPIYR